MLLSVKNLVGGYSTDNIVINRVELAVDDDETVVVIGPNGAGKSTLLKCVVGLLSAFGGVIELCGTEITEWDATRRARNGMAYVGQSANIFPSLTVWENLIVAARGGGSRHTAQQRIDEVVSIFPELESFGRKLGVLLSGGQRQIVAVAMAMSRAPRIIVMDEPSAGLAPSLAKHMFEQIAKVRQHGVSVLLVEQNALEAIQHCDRGYVLEMGRNAISGTRDQLLANDSVEKVYLGKGTSVFQ